MAGLTASLRIVGYVLGVLALIYPVLSTRFELGRFEFGQDTHVTVFFLGLISFPIGCLLDFLGRRKQVLRPIPFYLLRVTALVGWCYFVFLFWVMVSFARDLRPEPLAEQGPDTAKARRALSGWFPAPPIDGFHNIYYFRDPVFTGRSYEFLRFDYTDKSTVVVRLARTEPLIPASPRDCVLSFAPDWWPRTATRITASFRLAASERLCLDEVDHRGYILVIGH
jgi:hypothetical protein